MLKEETRLELLKLSASILNERTMTRTLLYKDIKELYQLLLGQMTEGADKDESIALEELQSPTDAELQKRGFPELIESRAVHFLCNLSDANLLEIVYGSIPAGLKDILSRLALTEIERRRDV